MSDEGKVVGLRGGAIPIRGRIEACVALARDLLEMAEAGEAVGIFYLVTSASGGVTEGQAGNVGSLGMIGSLEVAKADFVAAHLMGDVEDV